MFCFGDQNHHSVIIAVIYNIIVIVYFFTDEWQQAYLVVKLNGFLKLINSPQGADFINRVVAGNPVMIHNILMDIQAIILAVMEPFLRNSEIAKRVDTDLPIPCAICHDYAETAIQSIFNNFTTAAVGTNPTLYTIPSTTYAVCKQLASGLNKSTATNATTTNTGGNNSPSQRAKRPNNDSRNDSTRDNKRTAPNATFTQEQINDLKKTGPFKLLKGRAINYPKPLKSRGNRFLCTNYATDGLWCRFGDKCNHVHINYAGCVGKEDQDSISAWLDTVDNMEWKPGHGPSTAARRSGK